LQPNPDEWNQAIQDCFKRLWPLEASQFGPVSYVELVNGSERSTILVAGSRKASRKDLGKRELRLRLLDRVQNERVNPRLHQGLREAIRVELNLTELPGAINARLREYARLESEAFQDRPIESSVQEVFESGGGQLLILGEPGSGKTTLLLELAQELIQEARSSPESAIPIVFSLPRWQLRRNSSERARTLSEWIEEDLVEEYGTSRRAAANLVQQDRVLPLLDGLDEVEVSHRSACVDQIHEYQRGRTSED
jgi:predicted NACHT family NTPase